MKYLFCLLMVLIPLTAFALEDSASVITTNADADEEKFNPRKGHWLATFGIESQKYEAVYDFQGEEESFKPEKKSLTGGRLGFGREFYLGKGLMTSTRIEGYYLGSLFSKTLTANPDVDIDYSFSKRTAQIWGADISQTLSFIFNMKTKNPIMQEWTYLTVEPFIEAGIGRANAYNRLNYTYDSSEGGTVVGDGVNEGYQHRVTDEILTQRLAFGINFTSTSGYFLLMRVSQMNYDLIRRREEGYIKQDDTASVPFKNSDVKAKLDTATVYTIGGGYKF